MSVLLVLATLVVTSLKVSLAVGVVGGGGGLITVGTVAVGAGGVGLVTALSSLMVASDELLTLVVLAVPVLALGALVVTGYEFLVTLVVVAVGVTVVSSTIVVGSSSVVVVVAVVGSGSSSVAVGIVISITLSVASLVALVVTSYKLLISLVVCVASISIGVGIGVGIVIGIVVGVLSLVVVLVSLGLVVVVLTALVMRLSFLSAEDGESESVCRESCSSHQSSNLSKARARNSAILREGLSGKDSDDNVGEIHLDLKVMV